MVGSGRGHGGAGAGRGGLYYFTLQGPGGLPVGIPVSSPFPVLLLFTPASLLLEGTVQKRASVRVGLIPVSFNSAGWVSDVPHDSRMRETRGSFPALTNTVSEYTRASRAEQINWFTSPPQAWGEATRFGAEHPASL